MGDGKWNGYEWFHGQHSGCLSLCLSLKEIASIAAAAAEAAVALFLPCVLLCLFVALGLYIFFLFPFFSLIIEPRCVCRNLPMIFIFIQRWSCKFEPNGRKTNALTNRRWLMIRPSAHCTTLQQPTNIHTLAIYVCIYVFKSWTPFVILLCLARLHNNYYSSIFHQLFILFLGWFCIALLTLKIKKNKKEEHQQVTNC